MSHAMEASILLLLVNCALANAVCYGYNCNRGYSSGVIFLIVAGSFWGAMLIICCPLYFYCRRRQSPSVIVGRVLPSNAPPQQSAATGLSYTNPTYSPYTTAAGFGQTQQFFPQTTMATPETRMYPPQKPQMMSAPPITEDTYSPPAPYNSDHPDGPPPTYQEQFQIPQKY